MSSLALTQDTVILINVIGETMKKLKNFYYIRHGQTDANKQRLMCGGGWDISLNDTGRKQAQRASLDPAQFSAKTHQIFCSPMKRALETARIINRLTNLPITIIEELREWQVGDWEGEPWDSVPHLFDIPTDAPHGETIESFSRRIERAVELIDGHSDLRIPIVVAHGAVYLQMARVLGIDFNAVIDNAKLYHIQLEQKGQWISDLVRPENSI